MNDLGIYLDNHATTQVAPEIVEALAEFLKIPGNASSVEHSHGLYMQKMVTDTVKSIKEYFKTPDYKVIFTSGTTESSNMIIRHFVESARETPKIICSAVEHPCILKPLEHFRDKGLCLMETIGVDAKGRIRLNELEQKAAGASLGCFMSVNNEIGNIYPVIEIGKILKKNNCKFLCDASQAVGKTIIDIKKSNIDYFLFSGHKIHALQGIGCIICKGEITPVFFGGGQQDGVRPGTLNCPGIFTLGKAIEHIKNNYKEDIEKVKAIKQHIWKQIKEVMPLAEETGDLENKGPHNLHFTVPGISNIALINQLRGKISISSGSACSSGTVSPSHVLRAMGMPKEKQNGAIRIGLSFLNNSSDYGYLMEYLKEGLAI